MDNRTEYGPIRHRLWAGALERWRAVQSPAPQLIETSRKQTASAGGMIDGGTHDAAAGRRGATARVWRSGVRPRWADVAAAQDHSGATAAAGRGPGDGLALARRHGGDADDLAG